MLEVMSSREPLRIGPITLDPPVVLAPMAGVTDAPFRVLCASFGGGLFVNQMVTARALLEGHAASWELARFHPAERVRSLQLYGTDPLTLGEAVRRLVAEDRVDHIDMNFGCPAAKVTRNGGGAALPYKRNLLRSVIRAAVTAAEAESGGRVPVTVKFRLGIDDEHLTYLETARIAESEGVAAVALHARTALQHYAPPAHWEAIARLRQEVGSIPVLGNGDIFSGGDALEMMATTGCDGVVIGRGCLGRPWLFRDLAAAFAGRPPLPPPTLGEVARTIRRHVELIVEWQGGEERLAHFRKHLAWYLKGYPVGSAVRADAGHVGSVSDIEALLDRLDPTVEAPEGVERIVRSHSNALRRVALPEGWLADPDEEVALPRGAEALVSGG
jgi:nifR3 family TIM-barrel protein